VNPRTTGPRVPTIVVALIAAFLIVSVCLAALSTGAAPAEPAASSSYDPASENAQRIRELTRPFTIAVLPDTQGYYKPGYVGFAKQIKWLLAHAADKNIVFVSHLGDVIDGYQGSGPAQWAKALNILKPLLAQDWLPFSIVRGNHEVYGEFLQKLPLSLMQSKPWFVAASPSGLCQAQKFQVEKAWFLHIGFQVWPVAADLQWANELLKQPSVQGMPVIVSAHHYLDGDHKGSTGSWLWNDFVKNHPLVFMVLCGHVAGEDAQVEYNAAGRPVYEMLSDYQRRDFGGNGLMRLVTVDPVKNTIDVKTFSPYFQFRNGDRPDTDYYETDADSRFQFSRASSFWVNVKERLAFDTTFELWQMPVVWW
jgi:hypothetical protein